MAPGPNPFASTTPANASSSGAGGAFLMGMRSTVNLFGGLDWAQGHVQSWWNGKTAEQNIQELKQQDAQARKDHPIAYYSGFGVTMVATLPIGGEFFGGAKVAAEGTELIEGASATRTALLAADAGVDAERLGAATRFGAEATSAGKTSGGVIDLVLNPETGVWELPQASRSLATTTERGLVRLKPPGPPAVIEGAADEVETGSNALARSEISEVGQTAGRGPSLGRFVKPAVYTAAALGGAALVTTMINSSNPAQAQTSQVTGDGTLTNGDGGHHDGAHDPDPGKVVKTEPAVTGNRNQRTPDNLLARINAITMDKGFGETASYAITRQSGPRAIKGMVEAVNVSLKDGSQMIINNGRVEVQKNGHSTVLTQDPNTKVWHDSSGGTINFNNKALSAGVGIYDEVFLTNFNAKPAPAAVVTPPPPPPPPPPEPTGRRPSNVVHFAFNSSALDADAASIIKTDAADLNSRGVTSIDVDGYTDEVGSAQYNKGLSDRRAQAVAQELKKDGYNGDVHTKGHGKSDPVVDTNKADVRNRRVSISGVGAPS